MSKFDEVTKRFGAVKHMGVREASVLRDLITESGAENLLECGFMHGKSSVYMGAILDDLGRGKLTTIDRTLSRDLSPNIDGMLADIGLAHRVDPIFVKRSYTWEMKKMLAAEPRPVFDFCYFDGSHVWDSTGFGVVLAGLLLAPGSYLVLDDLNWSLATSPSLKDAPHIRENFTDDEREAQSVRLVWDLLIPEIGFEKVREDTALAWGIARKKG